MDKDYIDKLAQNPDFIPGVYNYCDRWCERCPFTSRCMNYAISEDHFDDPESRDIRNEAFWKKLGEVFAFTRQMVEESAEMLGIDLDSLDLDATKEELAERKEKAESHECALAAKEYIEKVKSWFDSAEDTFQRKEDELNAEAQLDLPGSDPEGDAATIIDAAEIIRWYQHFIYVKLVRALKGTIDEDEEPPDEYPKDSDGSAKIALIAIDRSIAAWGKIYEHFDEDEDEILDMLVLLDRLRRKTESVFPNARKFHRAGFDD
ncbi:MAG: hypothetical protein ACYS8Z_17495 [Planctomycetota bacterium]|jgi:hypothetical protein